MTTRKLFLGQAVAQQQHLLIGQTLLGVPVLVVERMLQKLLQDPAAIEAKISQLASESGNKSSVVNYENPFFYVRLFRAINGDQRLSGTVVGTRTSSDHGILNQVEKDCPVTVPDVTFEVTGFGVFSITPAEHFKPSSPELLLLQVPKSVAGFAQWLISQKNWILKTLGDCYFRIGKAQAAFLLSLHPDHLRELSISSVANALGLPHHSSTYFRLLKNRSVRVSAPHVARTIPINFLLPNKEQIAMYYWVPTFDRVMRDELAARTALSDEDLSVLIKHVARRTVAKYRELANIPSRPGRQEAYNKGRGKPYRISLEIERFLQEDWSSTSVRDRHSATHGQ
jgi:hypothetical protein